MGNKRLKKNSFIEGTMIAYVSIILSKIIGMLYTIPFYAVIGETGGFIYSCAYSIYELFLNASTSGVPTAMAIIIAEYNTRGLQRNKQKIYRTGVTSVAIISFVLFLFMMIFARQIGGYYMDDMTKGCSVNDIAAAVRSVSICLVIVPFLSLKRGYFQGHKIIAASSYSQVIEQFVRVAAVLLGSYAAIKLFKFPVGTGVNAALLGAALGALAGYMFLLIKERQNREIFICESSVQSEPPLSTGKIIKMILRYSIPVVIVAVSSNIYELIDMKLVIMALTDLGYKNTAVQAISSIIVSWGPKVCMIVSALAMGIVASLVPNMASSYAKGNLKEVNRKFNLSINTILIVTSPMAIGISMLSKPVYTFFYGESEFGPFMLIFGVVVSVIASIKLVMGMALQSMGQARLVCTAAIIGIIINAGLDLPLIYLCSFVGIPAYVGAYIATYIGYCSTIVIIMSALKSSNGFKYMPILKMAVRIIIPNLAVAAVIFLLGLIAPIPSGRGVVQTLMLGGYVAVAGAVYVVICCKNKAMFEVFGKDSVRKMLNKFHLRFLANFLVGKE